MLALLGVTLALAGCATVPRAAITPVPARVAVLNLTPYAWRITLVATQGGSRVLSVDPAATVEIELAGGDYQIEQVPLSAAEWREPARRFPVTFAAGQTYRWPLATLGTDDAAVSERDGR